MRKYSLKYYCLYLPELESPLKNVVVPLSLRVCEPTNGVSMRDVVFRETLNLGIIFYVHTVRSSRHNTSFRVHYGIEPESYSTMGNICMASIQAGSKFSDVLGDSGRKIVGYQVSYLQGELHWVCPFEGLGKVLSQNFHIRTQEYLLEDN